MNRAIGKIVVAVAMAIFLTACTNPLADQTLLNPLVHPPWEAFVRAGPNAEKEIDYETLNGPSIPDAQPQELIPDQDITVADVADLPTEEQQAASEGKTLIKAIAVLPVKGAGTKGDGELTAAMRNVLGDSGLPVIAKPRKDALNIQGRVAFMDKDKATQTVTIVWLVTTPQGKTVGDVRQGNDIERNSLKEGWGETAEIVAQAAAEGIAKLVQSQR
jgi:hypothetical protein